MHASRVPLTGRLLARLRLLLALLAVLALGPLPQAGATALAAPGQQSAVLRDTRFGINETAAPGMTAVAERAGSGWSRVTFWWSQMQKGGPGELDMFATEQDAYINEEVAHGRHLAGVILNVPGWASRDGSPNGVPKGLHLPWDHPENYWGRFMRRMAEHYRGRIDSWIIWNEVDIPGGQWRTWNGSVEEYVQLLKVAYRAVKSANPRATVVPYGAAWWYDHGAGVSQMLDLLAADPEARANNYFFDAGNLHLYSRADDIPRIVGWYRSQLATRGMDKPIWVGETNAIPWDDPIWPADKAGFRATMDEQASYIIQAFATYVGVGVERMSVNRVSDGRDFDAGGEPFGLLRNDGSTRPAFTAYQVVTRYFAGAREASLVPSDNGQVTRVVIQKENERVTVAWTMRPYPVQMLLDAVAPRALLVTKYGDSRTIEAPLGRYSLELAPATANSNEHDRRDYVVGGDPIIIVERTDGDTQAAFRSLDVNPRAR